MRFMSFVAALALCLPGVAFGQGVLPSWTEGPAKAAIIDFVTDTTRAGSADYIAPEDRIAVFDNDGTLWAETPFYAQLYFALDRIRAMAPDHPDWAETQPFKAVLDGDVAGVLATGEEGVLQVLATSHAGMTAGEFDTIVRDWIATAEHPGYGRPFTELTYVPMRELLDYLRDNGFQTWIVSGGGTDFMRPWTTAAYGIPPNQVIGSMIGLRYEFADGKGDFRREAALDFNDDKANKPVAIQRHIGKRPVLAFGNSDGDFEMLEYTTSGDGRRLGLLLHHTDARREAAYDRDSAVGRLARGLDQAGAKGWVLVDMAAEWQTVFAPKD